MSERYTHVAIALHWTIAWLIVIALALGLTIDLVPATLKSAAINAHALLGLAVLALSLYRLAWRLGHRPPDERFCRDVLALHHGGRAGRRIAQARG